MNEHKATVKKLLKERRVAYQPMVAKAVGGATAGLFLSQLMYWSDITEDEEGWIYKTQEEWWDETALTRREQETARKHLRTLAVIEENNARLEHRLYYRILWENLLNLIFADVQNVHSRMSESAIGECPKAPSDPFTETTTETTTEKGDAEASAPLPKRIISKITETFMLQMEDQYPTLNVPNEVSRAMSRNAFTKTSDKQKYVTEWLDRGVKFQERSPPSSAPKSRRAALLSPEEMPSEF